MYSEWRRGGNYNAKWSCICNYSSLHQSWDPSTHMREEGSMAYRRPSFGPSDEGYRSEYDITMTASMSLTSPDHYLQADSLL